MPKIVDKEQKQSEIARVALMLFAEKGFEKTTLQNIASASGLGKGTLYHYFHSKFDILKKTVDEIMNEFADAIESAVFNEADPEKQIRSLFDQTIEWSLMVEPVLIVYMEMILINLRNNDYGDFLNDIRKLVSDYRIWLGDIIEKGKSEGKFKAEVDAKSLSVYLVASMDGLFLHYILDNRNFDLKAATDEFLKTLFNGLFKGD